MSTDLFSPLTGGGHQRVKQAINIPETASPQMVCFDDDFAFDFDTCIDDCLSVCCSPFWNQENHPGCQCCNCRDDC